MKLLPQTLIAAAVLSLSGCAGLMPPKTEDMARVPVVRYGDAAPAGQEFVMFFPAGMELPVVATVDGTLLEQQAKANMQVSLKRDVYIYQHWVSFDGKTWLVSRDAIDGRFEIKLPGDKDGKAPGRMSAEFNLK